MGIKWADKHISANGQSLTLLLAVNVCSNLIATQWLLRNANKFSITVGTGAGSMSMVPSFRSFIKSISLSRACSGARSGARSGIRYCSGYAPIPILSRNALDPVLLLLAAWSTVHSSM